MIYIIFIVMLTIQIIDTVLLLKMRRGATFVSVEQKHYYVPTKKKKPVVIMDDDDNFE